MQCLDNKVIEIDTWTSKVKYYLLSQGTKYGWETRFLKPNRFCLEGIIQIPQSLYILQNLYFGYGNDVENFAIEEQAGLFYFKDEPIESYNFDNIESLMALGLIDNNSNQERLENNSKLVKRLKDYNRDYR